MGALRRARRRRHGPRRRHARGLLSLQPGARGLHHRTARRRAHRPREHERHARRVGSEADDCGGYRDVQAPLAPLGALPREPHGRGRRNRGLVRAGRRPARLRVVLRTRPHLAGLAPDARAHGDRLRPALRPAAGRTRLPQLQAPVPRLRSRLPGDAVASRLSRLGRRQSRGTSRARPVRGLRRPQARPRAGHPLLDGERVARRDRAGLRARLGALLPQRPL